MGPVLIYEISSYGDVKLARTMDIQKHCNIESPKGFEIFKYIYFNLLPVSNHAHD